MRGRAAIVGAVAIALLLSSCAAGPTASRAEPTIGECRQLDRPEHFAVLSDASPAVDCAAPHTVETYAVGELARDADARYPALAERETIAAEACPATGVRDYLGAGVRQGLYGVWTLAVLPTPARWTAGERWVRCDLMLVADERGAFDPLVRTATLRGAAQGAQADAVSRCYTSLGHESAAADEVRCSEPHLARDVDDWLSRRGLGLDALAQLCAPAVEQWAAQSGIAAASDVALVTEDNGVVTARCVAVDGVDG